MGKFAGLSSPQAEKLLAEHGLNEIIEGRKKSVAVLFLSQFGGFLVGLLVAAAAVSFFLGDRLDAFFILLIVCLNAGLGFIQEFKAEKAILALKKLTVSKTRVVRGGAESEIDSRFLVPGDVFFIEEGGRIPADGQILEALNLEVNESSLTGESLPVSKESGTADERSSVFSGTVVSRGRATVMVMQTGMTTRFGKIAASLAQISEEETPLEKNLGLLGKQLAVIGILLSFLVFLISFYQNQHLFESFFTSVSLAVAAVPEGLPAVMTITLAVGMQRMSRRRAIVRKLAAIEALGSVSLIATDKTGTLTRGEMTVRRLFIDGAVFPVSHFTGEKAPPTLVKLLEVGSLCNTASLIFVHDRGHFAAVGDMTEGALLFLAQKLGRPRESFEADSELRDEFPFDAKLRLMTVVRSRRGRVEVLTKGAPEAVLERCRRLLKEDKTQPLTEADRREIRFVYEAMAKEGLRVLALAFRRLEEGESVRSRDEVESDLIFTGLVGIADPPRAEVAESIRLARQAGIATIMVTGDNELTANAIATEIGLIAEGEEIITGENLARFTDEELNRVLARVRIFARVTPEHKLRIVTALKRLGGVVAVTGDGVNDALALKQADVGVAMGITGTDVAKEASDIVITDDNYATIVGAVEEGRVIFDNIVKAVVYLTTCNLGEITVILTAVSLGFPTPLLPAQILWMNLVTDGLPALALAVDEKGANVMRRPPRAVRSGILNRESLAFVIAGGLALGLLTLAVFAAVLYRGGLTPARAVAFNLLIFLQLVMAFLVRKNRHLESNRLLLLAAALVLLLQWLILTVPFLRSLFGLGL